MTSLFLEVSDGSDKKSGSMALGGGVSYICEDSTNKSSLYSGTLIFDSESTNLAPLRLAGPDACLVALCLLIESLHSS